MNIDSTYASLSNTPPKQNPPDSPSSFSASIEQLSGPLKYTLKNDYLFKATFQKNQHVLHGFLSSLLNIPITDITHTHIENPIQIGADISNKDMILDLLVTLNHERRINIELQILHQSFWPERSLGYACKTFTNQLKKGQNYDTLMQTIHIAIIDFPLFPDEHIFYSQNFFMDVVTRRIYSDKLSIYVLCLKHIEHATQADYDSGLYQWAKLFSATTWEELKMIAQNNTTINDAVCTIQELTADERVRLQCEARERYERDWNSEMSAMHKKGLQEGIQQERERNRLERQKNLNIIQTKEAELKAKDSQLKAKDSQLKSKDSQLKSKDFQLEAMSSEMADLKAELESLKSQLSSQNLR